MLGDKFDRVKDDSIADPHANSQVLLILADSIDP